MNQYGPNNIPKRGTAKKIWDACVAAGIEVLELHYNPNCFGHRERGYGTWAGRFAETTKPTALPSNAASVGLQCGWDNQHGMWFRGLSPGSTAIALSQITQAKEKEQQKQQVQSNDSTLSLPALPPTSVTPTMADLEEYAEFRRDCWALQGEIADRIAKYRRQVESIGSPFRRRGETYKSAVIRGRKRASLLQSLQLAEEDLQRVVDHANSLWSPTDMSYDMQRSDWFDFLSKGLPLPPDRARLYERNTQEINT